MTQTRAQTTSGTELITELEPEFDWDMTFEVVSSSRVSIRPEKPIRSSRVSPVAIVLDSVGPGAELTLVEADGSTRIWRRTS